MNTRHHGRATRLDQSNPRVPPTQFLIWRIGKVDTLKGVFLFDHKAAQSVLAKWKDWGNRITFDYEHKATNPEGRPGDGISAGSCLLQLRSDGLYATDVRWTDTAARELRAGQWLYFSPTFLSDEKTGRILDLINIALTNIPATKGMTPLVAASRTPRNPMATKSKKKVALDTTMPKARKNPAVPTANVPSKQPNPAVATGEETEGTSAPVVPAEDDASKAAAATKIKAAKKRLAEAKLEHELAQTEHDAVCGKMSNGDDDGDMDDAGDGKEPDDGIINDEDQDSDDPDEPANHLDQDSDDPDEPANHLDEEDGYDDGDDDDDDDDEEDDAMSAVPAPIGPKSAPPGANVKSKKIGKLSASDRAILAVTGESDLRRATGKLYALGLQKKSLAKATRAQEFTALAKEHARPGSLTPRAEKLGRTIFAKLGRDEAIGFLSGLPVVGITPGTKSNPSVRSMQTLGLTKEEIAMCKQLGNDPEKYAAQKRTNAERLERMKRGEE